MRADTDTSISRPRVLRIVAFFWDLPTVIAVALLVFLFGYLFFDSVEVFAYFALGTIAYGLGVYPSAQAARSDEYP